MKKILKGLLLMGGSLLLCLAVYAGYLMLSYARIPDCQPLEVAHGANEMSAFTTDASYRAISFNIGFGAFTPEFSFFMDGGVSAWGKSRESVEAAVRGAAQLVSSRRPDLIAFQEVDVAGTRSYQVDQYRLLTEIFLDYSRIFAVNYDSAFLFYPLHQPIGKNKSGLATYSARGMDSGLRRSLPISDGFSKFLDLDRAYSISRIKTANNKYLVFINTHLSAYGADKSIREKQLALLSEDMQKEYELGNYVIVAGDFNHDLRERTEIVRLSWTQPFPRELLPKSFVPALDRLPEINRRSMPESARNVDEPYTLGKTLTFMVDGFLVSENIEVEGLEVISTGFLYSDHEPVELTFRLK